MPDTGDDVAQLGKTAESGVCLKTDEDDVGGASLITADTARRYAIGEQIAAGGMGAILNARDLNCRRTVAMKVMLPAAQGNNAMCLHFIEEAQITSQLEHPNIVPVHELGVNADGTVFYTMKLVRGVTLKRILDEIKAGNRATIAKYPLGQMLTVFIKVCDAVAFAHSRGVIHRDLKPENIMVGEFGEVSVMDWGLAKVLKRDKGTTQTREAEGLRDAALQQAAAGLGGSAIDSARQDAADGDAMRTMEGQAVGTPAYMSPEQALGKIQQLDERTDIYALGAILYHILTLFPPVAGGNVQQVLMKVAKGEIAPPTSFNQGTPTRRPAAAGGQAVAPRKASTKADLRKLAQAAIQAQHQAAEAKLPALPHLPGNRVPAALSSVTMKALARLPEERYASVAALQAELAAYQGGFATEAEEAGLATQLLLLVKRHKALFGLAAAALLLLLLVVTGFVTRLAQEKRLAVQAKDQALAAKADAEKARTAQATLSQKAAPKFLAEARRLTDLKEWDKALEAARTASELDPTLAAAWFERGLLELGSLNFGDAVDVLGKAAALAAPGSEDWDKAERYGKYASQCRQSVAAKAGMNDKEIAYALAKALGKNGEYVVSARLYEQSGKAPAGGRMTLAKMAVIAGLSKCNPGLDATQVTFDESEPANPRLTCPAEKLVDIAPLAGTPFVSLDLSGSQVRDLAPLKGMPLRRLDLAWTRVVDLAPLAAMPLVRLELLSTNVADLTPLATCTKLESLSLADTKVRDLTPLKGLPLLVLNLTRTQVTDLAPLSGLKQLETLDLTGTAVADLAPLKGMPLHKLLLRGTKVRDVSTLAGLPLSVLNLTGTGVTDLTPLAALSLERLSVTTKNITKGLAIAQRQMAAIADLGMEFVPIPAGTFEMGEPGSGCKVTISKPFFVGATEVTQAQYQAVMGTNPSSFTGEDLPVETVSWTDAVAFCAKLTERERGTGRLRAGMVYRLLTEAEWEYACRAGTTTAYSFGDDAGLLCRYGNYADKSFGRPDADLKHDDGFANTAPVGSFAPNPWGLYDMHGNVWEWCSDWYGDCPKGAVTDPQGGAKGTGRVIRGGGWASPASSARLATRSNDVPSLRPSDRGFRLAMSSAGQ